MSAPDISVLILTLDEEINLPECLESVSWSNDVVVFDSYSADRTEEIANNGGARVVKRTFDNYAAQRNAALTEVDYKNDWVLMVDADERWSTDLFVEMQKAIQEHGADTAIFHFTRNDFFFGRKLAHSIATSTWAGRLVKRGHVSVERGINEEYHTTGGKRFLPLKFDHHPFSKGIAWWFERHNRYSSMEAAALVDEVTEKFNASHLFSRVATQRRKALKQLAYRLPGRPQLVFIYLYCVKLGMLDGIPGLRYCRMRAMYEYMIDLKVAEARHIVQSNGTDLHV